MFAEELIKNSEEKRERHFVQSITERTWGRIQRLKVNLAEGRLVIQGSAPSYYLKQLALNAVRRVDPTIPMDLQIKVSGRN